jgi:hypothetical protein
MLKVILPVEASGGSISAKQAEKTTEAKRAVKPAPIIFFIFMLLQQK